MQAKKRSSQLYMNECGESLNTYHDPMRNKNAVDASAYRDVSVAVLFAVSLSLWWLGAGCEGPAREKAEQ